MGVVSIAQALGGAGVPDLGRWQLVAVREPSSMDASYVYFDVSDIVATGKKLYGFLMATVSHSGGSDNDYNQYFQVYSAGAFPSSSNTGPVFHSNSTRFQVLNGAPYGISTFSHGADYVSGSSEVKARTEGTPESGLLLVFELVK